MRAVGTIHPYGSTGPPIPGDLDAFYYPPASHPIRVLEPAVGAVVIACGAGWRRPESGGKPTSPVLSGASVVYGPPVEKAYLRSTLVLPSEPMFGWPVLSKAREV